MAKTAKGLLEHCKKASNWKYVYGAKGKVLTRAQIQSLKNMYGSLVWSTDLNKAGNVCCDCSGLISSYTGIVRSSANYKATATATATIAQLKNNWKAYIGWAIWMNGHIGVVSDVEGYYYAMDGSSRNWVHNPISMNKWQYVIKLRDIDYSIGTSSIVTPSTILGNTANTDINVFYCAFAGKWYSEIKNCNDTSCEGYAGVNNKAISGLAVKSDKGVVKLRVHIKGGGWLAWVTKYDINDDKYGYAGILGKEIDGIQMEINGMPGYNIEYRVSTVGNPDYLPWVTNWDDSADGYAGIYGKAIDKVQIKVVKKE
ncbi:MAG: hypothetical protein K2M60_04090 [Lachnospiraceae bacterium]|nr:hypothetical protein [Lachnospiraceae bacterium]MDE6251133.1 hypothetical protein [Lachnospiraceae bacterium]